MTFSTSSYDERVSTAPSRLSPMAAITVRSVPTITCALSPSDSTRRAIRWIISCVALRFITTIIGRSLERACSLASGSKTVMNEAGVNERGPEIDGDFRASESCG